MEPKSFTKLLQLSPSDRVARIAEGLSAIAEHVAKLELAAADLSESGHERSAEVLRVIAEEEAGKYLILLDAFRAPSSDNKAWSRQLKRCSQHISKGIYALAVGYSPATFGELRDLVDFHRRSLYLDGPNDIDWIFTNEIVRQREQRLYVDYVDTDDGPFWSAPDHLDNMSANRPPEAARLVQALHEIGCSSQPGLETIRQTWAGWLPTGDAHYQDMVPRIKATVESVRVASGDSGTANDAADTIVDTWPFPLVGIDVEELKVDRDQLRAEQREAISELLAEFDS